MERIRTMVDGVHCVRLEWEDGSWWTITQEMPFGVRRRIMEAVMPYGAGQEFTPESVPAEAMVKISAVSTEQTLVGCTVEWSWDKPVSIDVIDKFPESRVDAVMQVMDELYRKEPERERETKNGSRSPSGRAIQSRKSTVRPSGTGNGSKRG